MDWPKLFQKYFGPMCGLFTILEIPTKVPEVLARQIGSSRLKSRTNATMTTKMVGDRRIAIDIAVLRSTFEADGYNAACRWIPGMQQVADALTKRFGNSGLQIIMETGRWCLRETPEVEEERRRVKELRRAAKDRRRRRHSQAAMRARSRSSATTTRGNANPFP